MLGLRTGWFKYEERCAALLMDKGVTCVGAAGPRVPQNMVTKVVVLSGALVWLVLARGSYPHQHFVTLVRPSPTTTAVSYV